ncbi:MAG: hypothetical protein HOJ34_05590 [Kordiimonadaceae bacterium]|mgnify:CR=1 FL=1|jgi:Bax protein|nr:hypothetical protein [Kordiimonadaceae bacterium]MBT6035305.1 hypothetical protein [Kordiimonadaceae bacterium]MBT6329237.1 hypothetical protein [Kordiimonadaceae bacterium]MBT7581435.1 hypothetical protein [Kordiimonadaceae bacterium]
MASVKRRQSSSFFRKAIIALALLTGFVYLPLYISYDEVNKSKNGFSTVTLIDHLKLADGENVTKAFASYGYNLNEIKNGDAEVPNLFLEKLPRELTTLKDAAVRKELFISSLLPPILKVNEFILYERSKLLEIVRSIELNGQATTNDLYWLRRKMLRYRMDNFNIEELYSRMNIIPPSLALTQAAIETGWGSSRFAQEANALYGQWTWSDDDGVVPLGRREGETHSVKKFENLISAVEGYALNLNTHEAYADFRLERSKFATPEDIKVYDLLITLIFYSEQGYEYIDNLNNIINVNGLGQFDNVRLKNNSLQEIRLDPAP